MRRDQGYYVSPPDRVWIIVALHLMLTHFVIKPLGQITRSADAISTGNFEVPEIDETKKDEVGALAVVFNRMLRSAFLSRFAEPELAGVAPAPVSAANFPAQILVAMEAELARHIGAIAKIVVKRSAARARDKKDLYTLLASEITDPARAHNFMAWAETKFGRH